MDSNWYVVQTQNGKEEVLKKKCQEMIPDAILTNCFVPYTERSRRYGGKWHTETKPLFPGYLFLISDDIKNIIPYLKQISLYTKLLGMKEDTIYSLYPEEVLFLKHFMNDENTTVELSTGIIEGDKVKIINGPLLGNEGIIKKIDRHKRICQIEVNLFGRVIESTVGLEVISKGL